MSIIQLQCPTVLLHRVNTNNGDKIKTRQKYSVHSAQQVTVSLHLSVCHCVTAVVLSQSVNWLIFVLDQSNPLLSLPDQLDCRSFSWHHPKIVRAHPAEKKTAITLASWLSIYLFCLWEMEVCPSSL